MFDCMIKYEILFSSTRKSDLRLNFCEVLHNYAQRLKIINSFFDVEKRDGLKRRKFLLDQINVIHE